MKIKAELSVYLAILAVFSVVTFYVLLESRSLIADDYYTNMAKSAEAIATVLSRSLAVTDKEVKELKKLSFEDTLEHPANMRLSRCTRDLGDIYNIHYAYLMMPLLPEEVKYRVTKENAKFFDAEEGTPLNLIWLLDVLCDEEGRKKVDTPEKKKEYYEDVFRYSILRDDLRNIFIYKRNKSFRDNDEWGDVIAGTAPIYTTEGNYIGAIGVDISIKKYTETWYKSFTKLLVAYAATFSMFLFLTLWIYRKFRKADLKAKYTDALTGAYNRHYYDEILPSMLYSARFKKYKYLAFIIIDMDNLKKNQ